MNHLSESKTETKKQTKKELKILSDDEAHLIVFNDDFNTFDHVIDCLIRICKLTTKEAIFHTFKVHNSGSSIVKSGDYNTLNDMKDLLIAETLTAMVQKSGLN